MTIAIVDSGVNDTVHPAFMGKFVAGFDAYNYNDSDRDGVDQNCEVDPNDEDCAPRDGTDNPDPNHPGAEFLLPDNHGTHVAGIALGAGSTGDCGPVSGDFTIKTCEGVAPAAQLVDVLACFTSSVTNEQVCSEVVEALDWPAEFAEVFEIDVVNMSLGQCHEDDGTGLRAQMTDYLAALGVVMVASHGNAEEDDCGDLEPGTRFVAAPASASFAITVSASEDRNTVDRADDQAWGQGLVGPRM